MMSLLEIIGIVAAVVIIAGITLWLLRCSRGADLTDDERATLKARIFGRFEIKGIRNRAALSKIYQAVDTGAKKRWVLPLCSGRFRCRPPTVIRHSPMLASVFPWNLDSFLH
jgi:hypothetical protein